MADPGSVTWDLEKYARYSLMRKGSSVGHWTHHSNTPTARLVMTLTEMNHLVVLQGSSVLESHSLVTARTWMRGLAKNDGLLFICKQGKGTRRFKVKFAGSGGITSTELSSRAVSKMSNFFCIHVTPSASTEGSKLVDANSSAANSHSTAVGGEITLGTLAHIVLGQDRQFQLPEVYKTTPEKDAGKSPHLYGDVTANQLRLFLADPTFPALVEQVDQHLQQIIAECQEE